MNLADFLTVLRRRWITFLLGFIVVVLASGAALYLQKPVYQATSTLALNLPLPSGNIASKIAISGGIINDLPALAPDYAVAATSDLTTTVAKGLMPAGVPLGSVTVSESQAAGYLIQLTASAPTARAAQLTAAAYVTALEKRVTAGDVGPPFISLIAETAPQTPSAPSSPKKKLTIGIGVILGLALGIAGAWVRDQVGGKVEDAEHLSQAAGAPVFGEIPESRRVPAITSVGILLHEDRLRLVNEAMRDLGVALQLTQFDADSVLITSPEGRHGKTTVSFGIAVALARSGIDTLLVDADLRRGRLEEMFSDDPAGIEKRPGLTEVLRGLPLEEAIQQTAQPRLTVLTSGELLEDPSDLLDAAFPAALREMERKRAVVLDGTPLLPINDARVMAKFCSATLLVAQAGAVSRRQVRRAIDRLRIINVTPTAVVLNRSRVAKTAGYAQYLQSRPNAPEETSPVGVSSTYP